MSTGYHLLLFLLKLYYPLDKVLKRRTYQVKGHLDACDYGSLLTDLEHVDWTKSKEFFTSVFAYCIPIERSLGGSKTSKFYL